MVPVVRGGFDGCTRPAFCGGKILRCRHYSRLSACVKPRVTSQLGGATTFVLYVCLLALQAFHAFKTQDVDVKSENKHCCRAYK